MTAEQIHLVDLEYRSLSGGETLRNGLWWDINGRDWRRADRALQGLPSDPQARLLAQANRLMCEAADERDGVANWLNNNLQSTFNNHGQNLARARTELENAYADYSLNPTAQNADALRRAMGESRQHLQSFEDARDSAADIVANALGSAAGIAVVVGSGGVATPIVVAIATGTGGVSQALARMGVSGTFEWDQLPANFVQGAVNAGTAALMFPAATQAALANGTAQIGVLRQVAGSAFVGGAAPMAVATALSSDTWSEGFATGVCNVAQASALGGFGGTVLAHVPGAGIYFARRALPFARTLVTGTGTAIVNLFDSAWVRAGVNAIRQTGQTIRQYLEGTLSGWAAKAELIAQRLISAGADETEAATRQALREILATTEWNQIQRDFVEEMAINALRNYRGQLSTLGVAGTRGVIEDGAQVAMISMKDSVDALRIRITTNAAGQVTGAFTDAQVDALAARLTALQNTDDASIRAALQAELGTATNFTTEMLGAIRNWRSTVGLIPQVDNNLLSALANASDAHHGAAVTYANLNSSSGLRINQYTLQEFLAHFTQADFDAIAATYKIQVITSVSAAEIDSAAARLQLAFRGSLRRLGDGDARVAATAFLTGEKIGTFDESFYKRCMDLGLPAQYLGDGAAAQRCADYRPRTVTIPPAGTQ